jgi:hypothetical protein
MGPTNKVSTKAARTTGGGGSNVAPAWRIATRDELVRALCKVLTRSHVTKAGDWDRGGVVDELAIDELHRDRLECAKGRVTYDTKTLEYEIYDVVVDLRTREVRR